ncbi:MAG: hypothetical protein JSW16_03845, partial [Dehalococcoidales bacterium]
MNKGLIFKIAITWLSVFILLGFFVTSRSADSPVTMSVLPEVPKEGEPIVATFKINNPADVLATTDYQLFANGKLITSGRVSVPPRTAVKYQYACANTLERGEQVNFVLKTESDRGNLDKTVSLPPYPSQMMSSFVSFA